MVKVPFRVTPTASEGGGTAELPKFVWAGTAELVVELVAELRNWSGTGRGTWELPVELVAELRNCQRHASGTGHGTGRGTAIRKT